jgi:4-hydroxy-L-threonine phosphate dehydrogenase PdxA
MNQSIKKKIIVIIGDTNGIPKDLKKKKENQKKNKVNLVMNET